MISLVCLLRFRRWVEVSGVQRTCSSVASVGLLNLPGLNVGLLDLLGFLDWPGLLALLGLLGLLDLLGLLAALCLFASLLTTLLACVHCFPVLVGLLP